MGRSTPSPTSSARARSRAARSNGSSASSSSRGNARPSTAAARIPSRSRESRSRRSVSRPWRLDGTTVASASCLAVSDPTGRGRPLTSSILTISSTNSGTPSAAAITRSRTGASSAVPWPTRSIARTSSGVSRPSSISRTGSPLPQGGWKLRRKVRTHRTGMFGTLVTIRPSSSTVVGSAQWRSSTMRSRGWRAGLATSSDSRERSSKARASRGISAGRAASSRAGSDSKLASRGTASTGSTPASRTASSSTWSRRSAESVPSRRRSRSRNRITGCSELLWWCAEHCHTCTAPTRSPSCSWRARTRRLLPMPASPATWATAPGVAEPREVRVAANQRRKAPGTDGLEAAHRAGRGHDAVRTHGTRHSLEHLLAQSLGLEEALDQVTSGLADHDRVRLGDRLEASGDVRRLPHDGELLTGLPGAHLARDDKSGVHTDPDTKGGVAMLVENAHLVEDAETGVHGSLRVVLVRARVAEVDHHTIADVLGRVTAEPLDRPGTRVLVVTDHLAEVLGVERLGQQG